MVAGRWWRAGVRHLSRRSRPAQHFLLCVRAGCRFSISDELQDPDVARSLAGCRGACPATIIKDFDRCAFYLPRARHTTAKMITADRPAERRSHGGASAVSPLAYDLYVWARGSPHGTYVSLVVSVNGAVAHDVRRCLHDDGLSSAAFI